MSEDNTVMQELQELNKAYDEEERKEQRKYIAVEMAKIFAGYYGYDEAGLVAETAVRVTDALLEKLGEAPSNGNQLNVVEMIAQSNKPEVKAALIEKFKDSGLWEGYKANIAEAFVDAASTNDLRDIANKGAELFLQRLCK